MTFTGFTIGAFNQRIATYTIAGSGGNWDILDNGLYGVAVAAGSVLDSGGNPVLATPMTTFRVAINGVYTVDNPGDAVDGNFGPGELSLREALTLANAVSGTDTINFSGTLANTTIGLGSELAITDAVTIDGGANSITLSPTAVSRHFNINIPNTAPSQTIEIKNLALTNGTLSSGNGGAITMVDESVTLTGMTFLNNRAASAGGAIATSGTNAVLIINDSLFQGNTASASAGGAIHIGAAANLTLVNTQILSNSAGGNGGAINGGSTLSLTTTSSVLSNNKSNALGGAIHFASANSTGNFTGTTFAGNAAGAATSAFGGAINASSTITLDFTGSTLSNNVGARGGAVMASNAAATITVNSSTVSGNTAHTTAGGGFYTAGGVLNISYSTFSGNVGTLGGGGLVGTTTAVTISSSTFSGNVATGANGGGAIRIGAAAGSLTIRNSTIAENTASNAAAKGGGILFAGGGAGTLILDSTILATNSAPTNPDITAAPGTTGFGTNNLFGRIDLALVSIDTLNNLFAQETDPTALDPLLYPLGFYGGPTKTHALQKGSPAEDKGSNISPTVTFDQRGSGFNRLVGVAPDVGATEGVLTLPTVLTVSGITNVTSAGGATYQFKVTYQSDNGLTGQDGADITVTGPSAVGAASVLGTVKTGNEYEVTYQFGAPGGAWALQHGGSYTISLNANQVFDTLPVPNAVPPETLGTFRVSIQNNYIVDNAADLDDGNYGVGQLTLREAVRLANINQLTDDRINFAASLDSITLQLALNELPITDPLTIEGNGAMATVISGAAVAAPTNRHFNINIPAIAAQTVTIKNLSLINATISSAAGGGSVLLSDESVTFIGVTFSGNRAAATGSGGGAVFTAAAGAVLTFDSCTLTNNSSTAAGGAVQAAAGSTVTVNNSNFNANTSAAGGGAIFANASVTFNSASSGFTGNVATGTGGALSLGNAGSATLGNSTFSANRTTSAGGAVSTLTSTYTLTINDSQFTGNSAGSTGGAVNSGSTISLTVTNSSFTDNTANTTGGAMHVGAGDAIITGSTFSGNRAVSTGGAINLPSSTFNWTIGTSTFTMNSSAVSGTSTGGGAIFAAGAGSILLNSAQFTGNSAGSAGGGAIAATSTITLDATSTTFSGNLAGAGGGGAIRVNNAASSVILTASTLTGNSAKGSGAGLYFAAAGSVSVTASTLENNVADGSGGAVRVGAATVSFVNSTIANNVAKGGQGGGGFRISGDGILSIQNSTISGNNATSGKGGGVYFASSAGQFLIESTILAGNLASGGGVDAFGSPVGNAILGAFNVIGSVDASLVLNDVVNNQFGVDSAPLNPGLFALSNVGGGPTRTMGLTYNSPALNKGSNPQLLTTDQRGAARPIDPAQTDVGAFEGTLALPFVASSSPIPDVTSASTVPVTVVVVYEDETNIDTASLGASDLIVTGPTPLGPVSFIGFTQSGKQVTATYTIAPPSGTWSLFDGGTYTVSVAGGSVLDLDVPANGILPTTLRTFRVNIGGTLLVSTLGDANDGNFAPGNLSLREAVAIANGVGSGIAIGFDPNVFASAQTITLTPANGGELPITGDVVINGTGPALLTVSGGGTGRIFNVSDGSGAVRTVNISGMTLTGGTVTGNGGAILLGGESLTLTNMVFTGNTVTGVGGGIAIASVSTLNISSATITANSSSSNGGFLANPGGGIPTVSFDAIVATGNRSGGAGGVLDTGGGGTKVSITNSTLSGNTANSNGGVFSGGYPQFSLTSSTLTGNSALSNGGAISLYSGTLTAINATIVGNTSTSNGGAISQNGTSTNAANAAKIRVYNSTVVNNRAGTNGGGIRVTNTNVTPEITIVSSVVSDNTATTGPDISRAGTAPNNIANITFSAIGTTTGYTLGGLSGNNLAFGTPVLLGPLQDNGGPTQTMVPLPGSPLIDQGTSTVSLATTDQRGFARIVDYPGVTALDDGTDIGATELRLPVKVANLVINNGAIQRSRVTEVTVSFDQIVTLAGGVTAAFQLVRVSDSATVTLDPVASIVDNSGAGTKVTLKFDLAGPAVSGSLGNVSLADGRYVLTAFSSAISNGDGALDGDSDQTPGGNYVTPSTPFIGPSTPPTGIYRLFGDADGSGRVDSSDFLAFRLAFLSSSPVFDDDGSGLVDSTDFLAFRLNFLKEAV